MTMLNADPNATSNDDRLMFIVQDLPVALNLKLSGSILIAKYYNLSQKLKVIEIDMMLPRCKCCCIHPGKVWLDCGAQVRSGKVAAYQALPLLAKLNLITATDVRYDRLPLSLGESLSLVRLLRRGKTCLLKRTKSYRQFLQLMF